MVLHFEYSCSILDISWTADTTSVVDIKVDAYPWPLHPTSLICLSVLIAKSIDAESFALTCERLSPKIVNFLTVTGFEVSRA